MLKFLSKVRIQYSPLDPRKAACVELLAQCNARRAKESNPACLVELRRAGEPRVAVTYFDGTEETIDATAEPAGEIKRRILERGRWLDTERMFREAGEKWPVVIPAEELGQEFPGTKPKKAEEKPQA